MKAWGVLSGVTRLAVAPLTALALLTGASPVHAASVIRVAKDAFLPFAGLITFSEFPGGTVNPSYTYSEYGGVIGQPKVSFNGFFAGQSLSSNPGIDCPGASASGCVVGNPVGPLSLNGSSPATFITGDGSNPSSPVLSGSPLFNGPISILFDADVVGVGLDGGFFDALGGTSIRAYGRTGELLGLTTNKSLGIEFLGLVTTDGSPAIAGLEFALVGGEPAGYAIDNLRFARQGEIIVNGASVPGPLPVAGASMALVLCRRLRSRVRFAKAIRFAKAT